MDIASKIREVRRQRGLHQHEVALSMGMSRPTYLLIENGKRQLTIPELQQLAGILAIPVEELLFSAKQITIGDLGLDKYKQIILNSIQYGADASDGRITKSKLAKLAYLADFAWFHTTGKSMSGLTYRRINYGPVPDQYFRVIDELYESGTLNLIPKGTAIMVEAIEPTAPSNLLSKEEKGLIKAIASRWQGKTTQEIVEFTHSQLPWKSVEQGQLIPYEVITREKASNLY